MLKPPDFTDLFLLKLAAILGIYPFFNKKHKKLEIKKAHTWTAFVLYMSLHVYTYSQRDMVSYLTSNNIQQKILYCALLVLYGTAATMLPLSSLKDIQSLYKDYSSLCELLATNSRAKLAHLYLLAGLTCSALASCVAYVKYYNPYDLVVLATFLMQFFFLGLLSTLKNILLTCIVTKLRQVNVELLDLIKFSRYSTTILKRRIEGLLRARNLASDVMDSFNKYFGWSMLQQFCLVTTTVVYMSCFEVENWKIFTWDMIFCYSIIELVFMVQAISLSSVTNSLQVEMSNCAALAGKLSIKYVNFPTLETALQVLRLATTGRNTQITAAGFLNFGYSMMFKWTNTMAFFVIAALQLKQVH